MFGQLFWALLAQFRGRRGPARYQSQPFAKGSMVNLPHDLEERPATLPFPLSAIHPEPAPAPTLFEAKWKAREAGRKFAAALRDHAHEGGFRGDGEGI